MLLCQSLRHRLLIRPLLRPSGGIRQGIIPNVTRSLGVYNESLYSMHQWHRHFVSFGTPSEENKEDLKPNAMSSLEKAKYYTAKYGIYIGAGTIGSYVLGKTMLTVIARLLDITMYDVGWYMYYFGFLTGFGTSASVAYAIDKMRLRPELVRNAAINMLSNSKQIQDKMGLSLLYPLNAGIVRAYTMEGGHFSIDAHSKSLVWRKPTIKMIFQVYGGNNHQAIVSLEAEKKLTKLNFTMLNIDFLTMNESMLVTGDASKLNDKDQLRNLIQLKKRYVHIESE